MTAIHSMFPNMGKLIANDRDSYQYLVESIRRFPKQDDFLAMVRKAGFENTKYRNLTMGVACLHSGWKLWRGPHNIWRLIRTGATLERTGAMGAVLNALEAPRSLRLVARILGAPFFWLGLKGDPNSAPTPRALTALGPAYIKFGQIPLDATRCCWIRNFRSTESLAGSIAPVFRCTSQADIFVRDRARSR